MSIEISGLECDHKNLLLRDVVFAEFVDFLLHLDQLLVDASVKR